MAAGRPRKMSVEESLERALELFWAKGYEATSIQDLSDALRVGPSSLYNTFGSKDALFVRAMEHYIAHEGAFMREALARPGAVEALTELLERAAARYARDGCQPGCAVVSAPRLLAQGHPEPDAFVTGAREATLEMVRARIVRGLDDGQLASDVDVDGLARLVLGTLQGMSMQACDGATPAQLGAYARQVIGLIEQHAAR